MRLPRFRVTVRRMMVAVAITSVIVGYDTMKRRRANYTAIASGHSRKQADYLDSADLERTIIVMYNYNKEENVSQSAEASRRVEKATRAAEHQGLLFQKYSQAALYPWLPVAPDPSGTE